MYEGKISFMIEFTSVLFHILASVIVYKSTQCKCVINSVKMAVFLLSL